MIDKNLLINKKVKVKYNNKIVTGTVKGRLLKFPSIVLSDELGFSCSWECVERAVLLGQTITV